MKPIHIASDSSYFELLMNKLKGEGFEEQTAAVGFSDPRGSILAYCGASVSDTHECVDLARFANKTRMDMPWYEGRPFCKACEDLT